MILTAIVFLSIFTFFLVMALGSIFSKFGELKKPDFYDNGDVLLNLILLGFNIFVLITLWRIYIQ